MPRRSISVNKHHHKISPPLSPSRESEANPFQIHGKFHLHFAYNGMSSSNLSTTDFSKLQNKTFHHVSKHPTIQRWYGVAHGHAHHVNLRLGFCWNFQNPLNASHLAELCATFLASECFEQCLFQCAKMPSFLQWSAYVDFAEAAWQWTQHSDHSACLQHQILVFRWFL